MDQNQFLKDFMKMRQELRSREATYAPTNHKNAPSNAKNAPSLKPLNQPSGMTFATLVETKPPKSDVIKYLRQKVDLLLDEMSD